MEVDETNQMRGETNSDKFDEKNLDLLKGFGGKVPRSYNKNVTMVEASH